LHYFGEEYTEDNCGMCDNCVHPRERFDGTDYVKIALQAVKQTNERFGLSHLVHVIRGVEDEYVKSYGHFDLPVYAKGSSEDSDFWKSIIRQALIYQFLEKDIDNIGALRLSKRGEAFLKKPYAIELARDHDFTTDLEDEEVSSEKTPANSKAYDEKLYELLKNLRKKIAKEKDLPPYVIFQDPSLEEIAESTRLSFEELLTEIENICFSGTKLNLSYYIDQVLDPQKQEEIHDYFMDSETDSLEAALSDQAISEYSEEEIRLMRIKFLSEYAN
jgi:ATP-dependent DNA helicase RecQ